MKIEITYKIGHVAFKAQADTIAEAYDFVGAILTANELNFPNRQESLSNYMGILVDMKSGKLMKHENHVFALRVLQDNPA